MQRTFVTVICVGAVCVAGGGLAWWFLPRGSPVRPEVDFPARLEDAPAPDRPRTASREVVALLPDASDPHVILVEEGLSPVVAVEIPLPILMVDVIDRESGTPVVGATVSVRVNDADVSSLSLGRFEGSTDGAGRARMEVLSGALVVVASTPDGRFGRVVLRGAWDEATPVVVTVDALVVIRGVVRDAVTRAPLAGVRVSNHVSAVVPGSTAVTDAAGEFIFSHWSVGDAATLAFDAAGYGSEHLTLIVHAIKGWTVLDAEPVTRWRDGAPFVEVDLNPAKVIRGRIVSWDGSSASDVRVRAIGRAVSSFALTVPDEGETRSASDGRFELGGLRSDVRHVVLCEAGDQGLALAFSGDGAVEQDLGRMVLAPAARVRGVLWDRLGRPLSGARVNLRVEDPSSLFPADDGGPWPPGILAALAGTTEADAQGRFEAGGIPPGSARLSVELGRRAVFDVRLDLHPHFTEDVGLIQVDVGVDFLDGVLVNARGEPLAGRRLDLFDDLGRNHATVVTGGDGGFRVALPQDDPEQVFAVEIGPDGLPGARWWIPAAGFTWLQHPAQEP